MAQRSSLGVFFAHSTVSCIGQADDTALISNDVQKLFYLLELTKIFCRKYQVELCADKTKLQAFATKEMDFPVEYARASHSIKIDGKKIPFTTNAEHVGLLRSTSGNGPTILARFAAHRRALQGILHTGMARGHRGNPSQGVHIDRIYAIPVLMTGLAPLVLSHHEILFDLVHANSLKERELFS